MQRVDLVLHEADQGGEDEDGAGQDARGDLEGDRLACPRRHDADAIVPGQHGLDDLELAGSKLVVTEDVTEDAPVAEAATEEVEAEEGAADEEASEDDAPEEDKA